MSQNKKLFYLISFIEGSIVMGTELLGAKMLAPFFGSSLYVWATVLAVTLGGLAGGYFIGGIISYKSKSKNILFYILLIAAGFTSLMPFISKIILQLVNSDILLFSIVISTTVFLLPPVFLMGMVSPLVIKEVTHNTEEAGKVAGSIYAISTVGGILSTFLFGFYIIPNFGLTLPCIFSGILLSIIPIIMLFKKDKTTILFIILLFSICSYKAIKKDTASDIKILYEKEGLLGQLIVADYPNYDTKGKVISYSRMLFSNRICQTYYSKSSDSATYLAYVKKLVSLTEGIPEGSNILILGLGGGSIANELIKKNHQVDAVELDKRVVLAAKEYFELNKNVNTYIDDARHYIKRCSKKYDVIIFDVFKGEENPTHIITEESIVEVKKILNKNGKIIINSNGYWDGEIGLGTQSIAQTILSSGFQIGIFPTSNNPSLRNILMLASDKLPPLNKSILSLNNMNGLVLKDDYPILDILNYKANKAWRTGYINNSIAYFQKSNIPLFN